MPNRLNDASEFVKNVQVILSRVHRTALITLDSELLHPQFRCYFVRDASMLFAINPREPRCVTQFKSLLNSLNRLAGLLTESEDALDEWANFSFELWGASIVYPAGERSLREDGQLVSAIVNELTQLTRSMTALLEEGELHVTQGMQAFLPQLASVLQILTPAQHSVRQLVNLPEQLGKITGIVLDQFDSAKALDYDYLVQCTTVISGHLQEMTRFVSSYAAQEAHDNPMPNGDLFATLQQHGTALAERLNRLREGQQYLPGKVVTLLAASQNVAALLNEIYKQLAQLDGAGEQAARVALNALREEHIPWLVCALDELETHFMLAPGALSSRLLPPIQALYQFLAESLDQNAAPLDMVAARIDRLSVLRDQSLLELARVNQAQSAAHKFWAILSKPSYQGKTLTQLQQSARYLLRQYYQCMQPYVAHEESALDQVLVKALMTEEVPRSWGRWLWRGRSPDQITRILSFQERFADALAAHQASVQLVLNINSEAQRVLYPQQPQLEDQVPELERDGVEDLVLQPYPVRGERVERLLLNAAFSLNNTLQEHRISLPYALPGLVERIVPDRMKNWWLVFQLGAKFSRIKPVCEAVSAELNQAWQALEFPVEVEGAHPGIVPVVLARQAPAWQEGLSRTQVRSLCVLNALFCIPEHLQWYHTGVNSFSEYMRNFYNQRPDRAFQVARIARHYESYAQFWLTAPGIYHLIQEMHQAIQQLDNIPCLSLPERLIFFQKKLTTLQLAVDNWEAKLHLAPGTLSTPVHRWGRQFWYHLLQPLRFRADCYLPMLMDSHCMDERLRAVYERLQGAVGREDSQVAASALEQIQFLQQARNEQNEQNTQNKMRYVRELFDEYFGELINKDGENASLRAWFSEGKRDEILEKGMQQEDNLQQNMAQWVADAVDEFNRLQVVQKALDGFKTYLFESNRAVSQNRSLFESVDTLRKKREWIGRLERQLGQSKPVDIVLQEMRALLSTPACQRDLLAYHHYKPLTFAWLKQCIVSLLEAVGLMHSQRKQVLNNLTDSLQQPKQHEYLSAHLGLFYANRRPYQLPQMPEQVAVALA